MSIFVLAKRFELGMEEFDGHHRHLVGLLNSTYKKFTAGSKNEFLGPILDELVDYATYHFAAEELWMMEHRYPNLEQHRTDHDWFCHRVVEIRKDYHGRTGSLTLEVLSFLNDWMLNHILTVDGEYGRFAAKLERADKS